MKLPLPRARKAKLVVVALFVFMAGGILFFSFGRDQRKQTLINEENGPQLTQQERAETQAVVDQDISDGILGAQAKREIKTGRFAAADKLYDDAARGQSPERSAHLYIDLSGLYYSEGHFDEALAAAEKANAADSDKYLFADWVSRLYEDHKDYKNAAKYYRLAGEWAHSDQNKGGYSKDYYEQKAENVEKLGRSQQ